VVQATAAGREVVREWPARERVFSTVTTAPSPETAEIGSIQRRVVLVLSAAQILGGIGTAAGAAVGALLAADLSSDAFSGVAAAASVVGAALIAIPVSRVMDEHGRRPGLLLAYAIGVIGALTIVTGAIVHFFPLALLGLIATGGGTTATLQSRYAATDLATPERRGRSLSTVIWATTIGSVLGPNLADPMGRFAESIGIPKLAGPYLLTVGVFVLAAVVVGILLRPDPLHVARHLHHGATGRPKTHVQRSMRSALTVISASSGARNALAAIVFGHAVMVAVMSMTPVHLRHADAGLGIIGLVISLHIAGMYALSPLVGTAVDRIGRRPVIVLGSMILLTSFVIAGTASGHEAPQLAIGLYLLGLGWSCTMIAGSTLLTDSVALEQLPNVQGTADVLMGFGGASAGLLAGLVVAVGSYAVLAMAAACLILVLLFTTLLQPRVVPVQSPA
jgi:MFS family permease